MYCELETLRGPYHTHVLRHALRHSLDEVHALLAALLVFSILERACGANPSEQCFLFLTDFFRNNNPSARDLPRSFRED